MSRPPLLIRGGENAKGRLRTCDSLEILSQPTFPASWTAVPRQEGNSTRPDVRFHSPARRDPFDRFLRFVGYFTAIGGPLPLIRKSLILIHRYLGIIFSLVFLIWFVSGIAMIY